MRPNTLVFWNAHRVVVNDVVLRQALTAVDPAMGRLVPQPVGCHTALRRAINRVQGRLPVGWRWQDMGLDDKRRHLKFALVDGKADASRTEWEARVRIAATADTATGLLTLDRDIADVAATVQKATSEMTSRYRIERRALTQQDVREVLLTILRSKQWGRGVLIKEQGGLYLLPAGHADIVGAITDAFAQAGMHLRSLQVEGAASAQFGADVAAGLVDEIAVLVSELAKRADGDKATKPSTLIARRQEIDELRERARLFDAVLREHGAKVAAAIADAEGLVSEIDAALFRQVADL